MNHRLPRPTLGGPIMFELTFHQEDPADPLLPSFCLFSNPSFWDPFGLAFLICSLVFCAFPFVYANGLRSAAFRLFETRTRDVFVLQALYQTPHTYIVSFDDYIFNFGIQETTSLTRQTRNPNKAGKG